MTFRGERLGLPAAGPGSVAGLGVRLIALFIDNALSQLIARAFTSDRYLTPFLIFVLQIAIFTWLVGGSVGQRMMSIRVHSLVRPRVTFLDALVRTFLLILVIPPAIYDRDQRGLHDRAVGTVVVRG